MAVQTGKTQFLSDYFVSNDKIFRIKFYENARFYVRVIIDKAFYINRIEFNKVYDNLSNETFEIANISAIILNSNFYVNTFYNVTDCKYLT